jgi:AbrB family looped-hinge helix DNA binding protein
MELPKDKYAWMVKIGEKGQFVIPKEARDMFDLQPGATILVLGDAKKGLAILPREMQSEFIGRLFSEMEQE